MLALDVSGSMLASDVSPSRIDASKAALKDFIDNSTFNSEIALLSFTSIVYVKETFTDEKFDLINSVDELDIRKTTGTSYGNLMTFSTALFEEDESLAKTKSLVMITDGQENVMTADEISDVTQHLTDNNIKIFIVGVGSEDGGKILSDVTGSSVINEASIVDIVGINGGNYTLANSKDDITEGLNSFFENTKTPRIYDLSLVMYMLAVVVLIFEWYFSNYIFRIYP